MDKELQDQLNKVRQQKEDKLKLQNLVEGLLFSFSINPNGHEFIWYFGEGIEYSNRAAITLWVKQSLEKNDFSSAEQGVLPALCSLFHDALDEMEDRHWV